MAPEKREAAAALLTEFALAPGYTYAPSRLTPAPLHRLAQRTSGEPAHRLPTIWGALTARKTATLFEYIFDPANAATLNVGPTYRYAGSVRFNFGPTANVGDDLVISMTGEAGAALSCHADRARRQVRQGVFDGAYSGRNVNLAFLPEYPDLRPPVHSITRVWPQPSPIRNVSHVTHVGHVPVENTFHGNIEISVDELGGWTYARVTRYTELETTETRKFWFGWEATLLHRYRQVNNQVPDPLTDRLPTRLLNGICQQGHALPFAQEHVPVAADYTAVLDLQLNGHGVHGLVRTALADPSWGAWEPLVRPAAGIIVD